MNTSTARFNGDRLKSARGNTGLEAKHVARIFAVTTERWLRWESGEEAPPAHMVEEFEDVFGWPTAWFSQTED